MKTWTQAKLLGAVCFIIAALAVGAALVAVRLPDNQAGAKGWIAMRDTSGAVFLIPDGPVPTALRGDLSGRRYTSWWQRKSGLAPQVGVAVTFLDDQQSPWAAINTEMRAEANHNSTVSSITPYREGDVAAKVVGMTPDHQRAVEYIEAVRMAGGKVVTVEAWTRNMYDEVWPVFERALVGVSGPDSVSDGVAWFSR